MSFYFKQEIETQCSSHCQICYKITHSFWVLRSSTHSNSDLLQLFHSTYGIVLQLTEHSTDSAVTFLALQWWFSIEYINGMKDLIDSQQFLSRSDLVSPELEFYLQRSAWYKQLSAQNRHMISTDIKSLILVNILLHTCTLVTTLSHCLLQKYLMVTFFTCRFVRLLWCGVSTITYFKIYSFWTWQSGLK